LNPHFLFNTLNGIYALSLEKSDKTASAIVKLSGMMRYLLTEAERDEVSLKNELEYIKDYIELQKLRLTDNNQLSVSVTGYPNGKKITPMILMTFIENAFKYGVNPEKDSRIDIDIKLENKSIILEVFNTKSRAINHEEEDGGRGLSHTLKILETRYSGHYVLENKDEGDTYRVYLKIEIED
jgi:LytS/YehU family sensor histidine kinase